MKRIIFLVLILLINFVAFSQLAYKKTSKDRGKYLEAQYKMENLDYDGAIVLYKEIISSNPEDYEAYVNIGYCYMHTTERYEAVSYLEKAVKYYKVNNKMKKADAQEAVYILAEAYYINYEFDNAKSTFEFLQGYSNRKQKEILSKRIIDCDFAKQKFENPKGFFVLESAVLNSKYPDYCPVVTADQSIMYFTSRRNGTTGGIKDYDGYFFEDIYSSENNDGQFSTPVNLGEPVNTDGFEATSSVSVDGSQLFIYRSTDKDPGDIYLSKYDGSNWSTPEKIEKPVNSKHNETHASLSPDGKTLFFTSDRKGGEGGLDIYTAELDTDGSWKNVQNMGATINTELDEEGPYMSPDGNTLYFSSQGHQGIGGFDIFKSIKQEDGTWSAPTNMGFPLNTVDDDIFFVPTADPITAYYSSKQYSGVSSIYMVQMYDDNPNLIYVKGYVFDSNPETLAFSSSNADSVKVGDKWYPKDKTYSYGGIDTLHITEVTGNNLIDSICKIPSNGKIYSYKVSNGELVGTFSPLAHKGKYGVPITPLGQHLLYYEADGYVYDIYNVKGKAGIYNYNADLDTIIYGSVKSVKNTEFEVENDELSDFQTKEFEILADFLNKNTDLFVDISTYGYTEAPETNDYDRTELIKNFLIDNGVNSKQIYEGLSPNSIMGDIAEYTIYDSLTIKKAIDEKGDGQLIANVKITKGTLVTDITFGINKFENPAFYADLNVIAEFLVDNSTAKVGVYGYTDTQGNTDYNKQLSEKRANFVKDYLISKGAKPEQIVAEGKGYSNQISKNKDNNGNFIWNSLGYNRRVEVVVLEQGENSKLFVKPVEVPSNLALQNPADYSYSVFVVSSEKQLQLTSFSFDVAELQGVDGLYNYIHGEFSTEAKAQEFVNQVKDKYPKAFIFINNYRK
ncbi:MAG: PD40 domain-containing protein [Bacteroidales bacterium]|nr:PD40 domain-containing protein [Bacteroidales bacterium]